MFPERAAEAAHQLQAEHHALEDHRALGHQLRELLDAVLGFRQGSDGGREALVELLLTLGGLLVHLSLVQAGNAEDVVGDGAHGLLDPGAALGPHHDEQQQQHRKEDEEAQRGAARELAQTMGYGKGQKKQHHAAQQDEHESHDDGGEEPREPLSRRHGNAALLQLKILLELHEKTLLLVHLIRLQVPTPRRCPSPIRPSPCDPDGCRAS